MKIFGRKPTQESLLDHLSKEAASKVTRGEDLPMKHLESATIHFAIVQIKDEDTSAIVQSIPLIVDLLLDHDGMIISATPPFVVSVFGVPAVEKTDGKIARDGAIRALLSSDIRSSVRVVHGSRAGAYGTVGSARYMNFSPVVPHFGDVFQSLLNLRFGTSKEV